MSYPIECLKEHLQSLSESLVSLREDEENYKKYLAYCENSIKETIEKINLTELAINNLSEKIDFIYLQDEQAKDRFIRKMVKTIKNKGNENND